MSDSVEKTIEQPGVTSATSIEMVKHKGDPDILTKRIRGESGKFQKQSKTMPKSLDVTRLLRNLLNQPLAGEDGKIRRSDATRMRKMFDNIYTIASTDPNQPVIDKLGYVVYLTNDKGEKRPLLIMDAKVAMASVQAFKELMLRAYGMPSKSDEEIDALKTQGVKIIILQHPELMDKVVVADKPKEPLKPAFIEGEFTENKN
jgi:hypothetical protein